MVSVDVKRRVYLCFWLVSVGVKQHLKTVYVDVKHHVHLCFWLVSVDVKQHLKMFLWT